MRLNQECPICKNIYEKEGTPEPDKICGDCEFSDHRKRELTYYALERLLEDTHEDSEYKEDEIVEVMNSIWNETLKEND